MPDILKKMPMLEDAGFRGQGVPSPIRLGIIFALVLLISQKLYGFWLMF
jgi:hypothetical protein